MYFQTPHPQDRHYICHMEEISEDDLKTVLHESGSPRFQIPFILRQLRRGGMITIKGMTYVWRDV